MKTHEMGRRNVIFWVGLLFLGLWLVVGSSVAFAKSAQEIDVSVDVALEQFKKDINGGEEFLKSAKGVLVFPRLSKQALLLVVNLVRVPCALEGRPLIITARQRPPGAS